jgi:hypothetical protein
MLVNFCYISIVMDDTGHYILAGVVILLIFLVIIAVVSHLVNPESFANKSEYGYYWETDTSSFVTADDKKLAVAVLLNKLRKAGITDITQEQLTGLADSVLLELLDMDYSRELTPVDIAALRMYVNPNYYLATVFTNEAKSRGNMYADPQKKALVYAIVQLFYKISNTTSELTPLSDIADTDLIKEFENVKQHKVLLESGAYPDVDMSKLEDMSKAYAKSTKLTRPKMVINDSTDIQGIVAPTITPATVNPSVSA